jgi:N-formylglutamate deformylase
MTAPTVFRGEAPLIVSVPHAGIEIPPEIEETLVSPWLGRKDADWWVDRLYGFVTNMGATVIRTTVSRTVIDVNRDPSGKSLYPGQATTELCPTTTFDGQPLYRPGRAPDDGEIARRRALRYDPYHAAIAAEIDRLKKTHGRVVLFDAHSIRSRVPRLFAGELPHLNFGTNGGASCALALTWQLERIADESRFSRATNGRFKGGYITRHYGTPANGVHAVQLELGMRSYMDEPDVISPGNWPTPFDANRAVGLQGLLARLLQTCIDFAIKDQT